MTSFLRGAARQLRGRDQTVTVESQLTGGADHYSMHTGAVYFKRITALESSRRARAAFQDLVLKIAPPGAALFDFGAGPGIDARFFAERGFTVDAYDVDPTMCEFFATHCRDFIDSGRITLDCREYPEFLARDTAASTRRIDLVISNFAPLNQVDDLRPLFAKFHALTTPGGKVLTSVLSPYFIGDMRFRWWWRNAPRLWRDRHFFVPGVRAPPHTRRRHADFAELCAPHFKLAHAFRGLPPLWGRDPDGVVMGPSGSCAWLPIATSRFMFLLFERRD
jgi:SAM-dependent methyltransferase